MKMDASYTCSWHIWNMKFCCILGHCSCIQQLITSRSWSSSLFTTLFSASEMHQGHHSGGLLCCGKGSIFIMQLQQLGCLKAALSTLLQSHIGEFGFLRLQKTKQNNPTQQQPKKPPQNKKTLLPCFDVPTSAMLKCFWVSGKAQTGPGKWWGVHLVQVAQLSWVGGNGWSPSQEAMNWQRPFVRTLCLTKGTGTAVLTMEGHM